jgi:hypothetical protein
LGYTLRSLFITALIFGPVGDPLVLWDHFKVHLCDDLARCLTRDNIPLPAFLSPKIDYSLYLIRKALLD